MKNYYVLIRKAVPTDDELNTTGVTVAAIRYNRKEVSKIREQCIREELEIGNVRLKGAKSGNVQTLTYADGSSITYQICIWRGTCC